jgi:hypothetical protein
MFEEGKGLDAGGHSPRVCIPPSRLRDHGRFASAAARSKLRVPIRMRAPLETLARPLQAIVQLLEQLRHLAVTDPMAAAPFVGDFPARYGSEVVLLETFVEQPRFRGTGYREANRQYPGETAGRGKLDRLGHAALPRKGVFAYPLVRDFRAASGVS